MKAFENKWDTLFGRNVFKNEEYKETKVYVEMGWKAALEWVLYIDFIHAMNKDFLLRKVKKELEIND